MYVVSKYGVIGYIRSWVVSDVINFLLYYIGLENIVVLFILECKVRFFIFLF